MTCTITASSATAENRDGVLLLVSVGDRKWHISTCGYGITAFTDAGIQYLGEQMTPFMADGDYAAAFRTFIQWSDTYVTAARAKATPTMWTTCPRSRCLIMYLVLALGIGLVTGMGRDRRDEKPAEERGAPAGRHQLCAAGQHEADQQRDLFLYRDVHRTERPKESSSGDSGGSSTHTSSSGSTHGGGGGSF